MHLVYNSLKVSQRFTPFFSPSFSFIYNILYQFEQYILRRGSHHFYLHAKFIENIVDLKLKY